MTKLLLPVKTGSLETPCREIDTFHTHTHTHPFTVCRENIYSWWGAAFMWEIRAQSWLKAVFSDQGLTTVSVAAPLLIPMCFNCFLLFINWFVHLYLTSLLLHSGHSPAVPHLQVSHVEVVPQWDDDEEGVQRSEVGSGNCRLHPPAAGRPCERITVSGGGSNFGCEWKTHVESTKLIPLYFKIKV